MKWLRKLLMFGVIGAVIFGAVTFINGRNDSAAKAGADAKAKVAAEPKIINVTVDPVTPRPIQRRVQVVGSLWGRDEVAITPKVEGPVLKIRALVGDSVRPGDVLLDIDEKNYQLAVNEATRSLELELSKLNLKSVLSTDVDINSLPSVAKAAALEKLAIANRDRLKKLVGTARATEEERDKAESEVSVAIANTRQMRLEAETVIAQVRHKQALLETAQQKLADTRVIVPIPTDAMGKVLTTAKASSIVYLVAQRNVSEGETVGSLLTSTPVYRLVIADPLKLLATIPERHIAEVKVGQSVEINVEAYEDEMFIGEVARVNPTVDRASRTFQAEILIRNSQFRLHAGSFAKGAILTRIDDRALTVPEEALATFAGVTKVFVLRGDKVRDVPVTTGVRFEDDRAGRRRVWVEVTGKLQPGDQVVTSGQSQLADGTKAKVRETSVK